MEDFSLKMMQRQTLPPEIRGGKKIAYILRTMVLFTMLAFVGAVASLNMVWVSLYEHTLFTSNTVSATGFDFIQHGMSILVFSVSGFSPLWLWTVLGTGLLGCITALFYWPPGAILRWKMLRYAVLVPLICGITGINACLQARQSINDFGTKELLFFTDVTMTAGPGLQVGLMAFVVATAVLAITVVFGEFFLYKLKRAA